jgi:hypothetical protein
MVYRKSGETVDGNPAAGDPDIYRISATVSEDIPVGASKLIQVFGIVTPTFFGDVDLFASIDVFSSSEVRADANHYGISGTGVYQR